MNILGSIKNFFCEEEKQAPVTRPDVPLINAEDLFPVRLKSDAEFMRDAVSRARANDEIKKKVQAEFIQDVERHKADLDQRPVQAPAPTPKEAKPDWLKNVDDKL